jgi:hypothetical protein
MSAPQSRNVVDEAEFDDLVERWHSETDDLSSPVRKTSHDAYLRIVSLGHAAIPLVLTELRDHGGYWYPALRALVGVSPVAPQSVGKPAEMTAAWLNWGRANGYDV